jgi:hypothetical protein
MLDTAIPPHGLQSPWASCHAGPVPETLHDVAGDPWLALGLDLRLTATAEGGRRTPIPFSEQFHYRSNWALPGMTGGQQTAGASTSELPPGGDARIVVIPLFDTELPLWRQVRDGDELQLLEGKRLRGHATVLWTAVTHRPVPADDQERFRAWTVSGGQHLDLLTGPRRLSFLDYLFLGRLESTSWD